MKLIKSENLIRKLKTYFPSLELNDHEISNSLGYVINGFPKLFGTALREARLKKGFSQKDMYLKLSVTPSTYSYWETGAHPPRVNKVLELVSILDVDVSDLIFENPVLSRDKAYFSIPVFNSDFFTNKSQDETLEFSMATDESFPRINLNYGESADFAFKVNNNEMMGKERGIPRDSIVLISTEKFKSQDLKSRMAIANGKVALVSICSLYATLREIRFDGSVLSLHSWNSEFSSLSFPVYVKGKKNIGTLWNNGETFAHNVQIYGLATKAFISL